MKVQMETPIKKAVCIAGKTAKNNNQQQKEYPQSVPLSSLKRNFSHQIQQRQRHGWFSDLLILTSAEARVKGHPKIATYYMWLVETATTNPRGGIVI